MPRAKLRACVIVPARNEAHLIESTVASLATQVGIDHAAFRVVVLANNSLDGTAEAARRAGRRHPRLDLTVLEHDFPDGEASVGAARRHLMDMAADCLPWHGVIVSTDGDTVVRSSWLAAMLSAIDRGADMVGGRILARATPGDPHLRRIYLADTTYRLLMTEVEAQLDPTPGDPWPRHFQHFGASLAVRRDAYLAVGGLPRVPHLEDVAMYERLCRTDAVIRHCPSVVATTSARLTGRAGVGLSTQLVEWRQQLDRGTAPIVESADYVIARASRRRALREAWTTGRTAGACEPFGCFGDREMASFEPPVQRLEPLGDAIATLRTRLVQLRRLGPVPLLLPPLEQIEAIRLLTPAQEVIKRSA